MVFSTQLINSGFEQCSSGHEFGGKRDYYLLHVVLDGKGEFFSNNKRWSLNKGDVFLIFPNQMHLYKADLKTPWNYFWVGFKGDYSQLFTPLQIDEKHPVFHCKDPGKIFNLYSKLDTDTIRPHPSVTLENLALLNMIIAEICRGRTTPDSKSDISKRTLENHVNSMEAFISENFNTPIQVQDVIDFAQLERSYASRIFKDVLGVSIGVSIRERRMAQAKKYLYEGWSAKETAYSCGYNDYHNFLKAFKQRFNITAGKYRTENR